MPAMVSAACVHCRLYVDEAFAVCAIAIYGGLPVVRINLDSHYYINLL